MEQPVAGPSHQVSWGPVQESSEPSHAQSNGFGGGRAVADWERLLLKPGGAPPPSPLTGSLDLISLFNLTPLYDSFLRPYLSDTPQGTNTPTSPKGKEKETKDSPPPAPGTPNAGASAGVMGAGAGAGAGFGKLSLSLAGVKILGEAGPGQGKKARMEKSYTHLVGDIPGRNKIKKDHHLRDLALNPDVQPAHIVQFEPETLREAFTLVPGQIPGFDAGTWEADQDTTKKKKKKRKLDADGADGAGSGAEGVAEGARKKKKRKDANGAASP